MPIAWSEYTATKNIVEAIRVWVLVIMFYFGLVVVGQ